MSCSQCPCSASYLGEITKYLLTLSLSHSVSLTRSSIISLVVVPAEPVKLSPCHINKYRHKQLPTPPKLMSIVPANAELETKH